jgi:hypothetical protein
VGQKINGNQIQDGGRSGHLGWVAELIIERNLSPVTPKWATIKSDQSTQALVRKSTEITNPRWRWQPSWMSSGAGHRKDLARQGPHPAIPLWQKHYGVLALPALVLCGLDDIYSLQSLDSCSPRWAHGPRTISYLKICSMFRWQKNLVLFFTFTWDHQLKFVCSNITQGLVIVG